MWNQDTEWQRDVKKYWVLASVGIDYRTLFHGSTFFEYLFITLLIFLEVLTLK